jgi:hypothetical protein
VAAALVLVWLAIDPRTPDLAAQIYRVDLFQQIGLGLYDAHWYAGHELLGYSLLFPPLGSWLGMRVVGALCAVVSASLFGRLVAPVYPHGGRAGAGAFAVAAVGDVWLGRLAFALGVSLGLWAVSSYARGRRWLAAPLCALCAAASPVAGLALGIAAATVAVARREPRALAALAVPGALVVLLLAWLFPEGGYEPFPLVSFAVTVAVLLAFLWALPRGEPLLRAGALVYLATCLLFLLLHSPVGSNVERYGVLLAGPLLLCARLERGRGAPSSNGRRGRGLGAYSALGVPGVLATALIGTWVLWGPVRETSAVAGSPATTTAYYEPVLRFFARLGNPPVRIEVPLTRSHWEAARLAGRVSLARGWDKQMDTRFDGVLLGSELNAASYERWLHREAVAFVVLPDVPLDPSSAREGRLIRGGLPYLKQVARSRHWRIYEVLGATPLLSGPAGQLTHLGHDSFAFEARAAGRYLVRVHFTRYWTVLRGQGCVARAPEDWTWVSVGRPARVEVGARFSLARAFAPDGGSCRSGGASSGSSP